MNSERPAFDQVCALVRTHLCVDTTRAITRDSHFENDLGADSLDAIKLAMAAEEEFAVRIEDDEIEKLRTVGDLVALIERRQGAGA
jgi:acyl carrier protein